MATMIGDQKLKALVATGRFEELFLDELLWDNPDALRTTPITLKGRGDDAGADNWTLEPVCQKRGVAVFTCAAPEAMPDKETRRRIARELQKTAHEHLIIFHTADFGQQVWFWPYREPGKPARPREIEFEAGMNAALLLNLLKDITFDFASEGTLVLTDVTAALNRGASPDRVTRRFYDEFSKQRNAFVTFIEGVTGDQDRDWYAAIMLNRLMFSWFLQSKGFLNGERDYLSRRLAMVEHGEIAGLSFHQFYQGFLRTLFHDGLNSPERSAELQAVLGNVPYINGGIFERHALETANPELNIPNEAFRKLFDFFGQYTWHLDDRPLGNEHEINPDVLGYIFEKFVNQKEKGAYYTKEDVTGYISQNTILPWLLDMARKNCRVAFDSAQPGNAWTLLKETPEKYLYKSMKHGVIDEFNAVLDLPEPLVAGEHDYAQRGSWNQRATAPHALPTETWREYFHRRRRTLDLRDKLANGDIHEVDDLITHNLDIRQFAQDVVENVGGVDLIRAFWKAIADITILDPTVGSGAFLFAAVRVVEPLYSGLLDRMELAAVAEPGARTKDFAAILNEAKSHPNRDYYVMRQIILSNLYGVDIEEEAVEICKLRLFLLLAAKLEEGKAIEPLPDIDFNIRAGNTLVGYATEDDVKKAAGGGQLSLVAGDPFAPINEAVALADQAYQHFKRTQGDDLAARADLPAAKAGYLARITELRNTLDKYLFEQQRPKDGFESWRRRTQPFHWFAEFHSIVIGKGGFDVIIGNPPYVEYSIGASNRNTQASVDGHTKYVTYRSGNLYALVMERVIGISETNARWSMIVPLSITFGDKLSTLRQLLGQTSSNIWHCSFDNIPDRLFTGSKQSDNTSSNNQQRTTIVLVAKDIAKGCCLLSTSIIRWKADERTSLFERLSFAMPVKSQGTEIWAKTGRDPFSRPLLSELRTWPNLGSMIQTNGQFALTVPKTGSYYVSAYVGTLERTKQATLRFQTENDRDLALLLLNSNVFFWWYRLFGDSFDVFLWLVKSCPVPATVEFNADFRKLVQETYEAIDSSSVAKRYRGVDVPNVNLNLSMKTLQNIDRWILSHTKIASSQKIDWYDLLRYKSNSWFSFNVPKSDGWPGVETSVDLGVISSAERD